MARYQIWREGSSSYTVWIISEHTGSKLECVLHGSLRECRAYVRVKNREAEAKVSR